MRLEGMTSDQGLCAGTEMSISFPSKEGGRLFDKQNNKTWNNVLKREMSLFSFFFLPFRDHVNEFIR